MWIQPQCRVRFIDVIRALMTRVHLGTLRFNELTVLVCLVMGTMRIIMGVLRFGFIADFISVPVLSSFVSGAG
jgi:MFS superfamily sulfate permease-like transporter